MLGRLNGDGSDEELQDAAMDLMEELQDAAMDPDEELQDAARRGDVALAEHALRQGARTQAVTTIGLRALHFAAQNGHDLLCELLLEEGADPNPEDKHGRTPIQLAAVRGHEATVGLLKEHGAELTDELQEKMEAAVFKRQHRVQHIHSVHQETSRLPARLSGGGSASSVSAITVRGCGTSKHPSRRTRLTSATQSRW